MTIEFSRIDHVAMAVEDVDRQAEIFEGVFGLRREATWEDGAERGILYRIGEATGNEAIRWEIVQPVRDESPLRAFLDSPRGPGVHHITFEVPDLEATRTQLQALGIRASSASSEHEVVVSADGAGEGIQLRFFAGERPVAEQAVEQRPDQTTTADRPHLGIRTLDHLSTAYPDRDELSRHYERILGMRQIWRTPDGAWPDFGDCILEIPGVPMHWEVIQPVGDESFIQSFLDRRGPAIHHVAFEVADFDEAKRACEYYELPTFDEHDDETEGVRWRDAFIHPRFTGGLLTQLFWEAQPGVWERSDKVRPEGYAG